VRNPLLPLTGGPDPTGETARRFLFWLIAAGTLIKIVFAVMLPLGADEAYATAVAREYSLSFFDHPPLGFWLPVAFADLTGMEFPLIYRAPFILTGMATTVLMFRIGRELAGNRAGLLAALLYLLAPFLLLSGGLFVVPDGPLNLLSALAVYCLVKIVNAGPQPARLHLWLLTGVWVAGALTSKYHAAWIPVAVLLFTVIDPKARKWFLTPGPWLAGFVGLIGLLPVVFWNAGHGWVSFAFHGSRAEGAVNPGNFAVTAALQALFLLPTGLFAAVAGIFRAIANRKTERAALLLVLVALGPVVIFNGIYLMSSAAFAHWTMPGWIFAMPLAGVWLAKLGLRQRRRFLRVSLVVAICIYLPLGLVVLQGKTGLLTRGFQGGPPDWDNTLVLSDLRPLKAALKTRGLWRKTDLLMAEGWIDGGRFATATQSEKPMRIYRGIGAHHFAFMEGATAQGRTLFMALSRINEAEGTGRTVLKKARTLDPNAHLLAPVLLKRGPDDYAAVTLVMLEI